MAIMKRSLSGENPKLTINLDEMFDGEFPDSKALKLAVGQAIIDRIRERTQDGVSKDGKSLKKYSKSYKNSLTFRAFGKSDEVNLTLSGDMLGLLDVVDDSGSDITIGWEDQTNAAKAHGHITGAEGRLPVRDFFGLPQKEIESIKEDLAERVASFKEGDADAARLEFLRDLLAGSGAVISEEGDE